MTNGKTLNQSDDQHESSDPTPCRLIITVVSMHNVAASFFFFSFFFLHVNHHNMKSSQFQMLVFIYGHTETKIYLSQVNM